MEKDGLQKVEYRVVVYYAGDADIVIHGMKSSQKIGPVEDLSLLFAFPEVEAVLVYPETHALTVRLGRTKEIMHIPVGGVVTFNHPEEEKDKKDEEENPPENPLDRLKPQ